MLTFNDKRYLMASIARKYAGVRYEIDELINEVWLDDNVRKQTELKEFCMAVHWAIRNYKRKEKKQYTNGRPKKYYVYFHPLVLGESNKMEPEIVYNDELSSSENIKEMLSVLGARQKAIVKLRIVDELTYDAIGKKFHICRERVRQILRESYIIMKKRYDRICA